MPPSPNINEPYWNSVHETWMRITKNGVLERLESGIMVPKFRPTAAVPDIKNKELAEELSTGKRWVATYEEDDQSKYPTKKSLIGELSKTYGNQGVEISPAFKQALESLSLYELSDAEYKLRGVPFSKQEAYRDHIYEYVSNRKETMFGENGSYPNEIGDLNASNIKSLVIDDGTVTSHMITVKHPKAGRVNLILEGENNPKWQVFDGLNEDADGKITFDTTKSDLLSKLGLAPYIEEIITELDASVLPRQEAAVVVDNIGTFNRQFNDITHVPPPNQSREQLGKIESLADYLIGNDKLFEVGISGARPENAMLQNPKVALTIFNNLGGTQANTILRDVDVMFRHNYLSAGHADVPANSSTVFSALLDRNMRGGVGDAKDPVTGYSRPVNQSGNVVPYAAMITEERAAFRNHFDDLYDRPKGWLQHTKEGQEAFNGVLDSIKTDFDWDAFVESTGAENSFFDPDEEDEDVAANPYKELKDVIRYGAVTGARLKYTTDGGALDMPLPELIKMLDATPDAATGQTIRDMLTVTQLAAIDAVMGNDNARLAYGIDDKEEGLRRKFTTDTFNELLGEPVIPKPDDWKSYGESGSDSLKMTVAGHGEINRDELYKQRKPGGLLEIVKPDEDGNYQMLHTPTGEFIDLPSYFASSEKTAKGHNQHIMDLGNHLDQSVLDQFVKDGVLPEEYASSEDIKARDGAPEAPEFGEEECLLRASFLSNILRTYQNMRGFDNEGGMYTYKLDSEDPSAELTKISDGDGNKLSIVKVLYDALNKSDSLGIEPNQFIYASDEVREDHREDPDGTFENVVLNGGGDDAPRLVGTPDEIAASLGQADDANEKLGDQQRRQQLRDMYEQEARTQGSTVGGQEASAKLKDRARQLRQTAATEGVILTDKDLDNDPRFQAYQEDLANQRDSDILANAPLDVRVTAYRMRIQGLQDRLDESTNMGEAYDIARDWFRVGAVEYPDIVQIDRDGTSKFKKLRDAVDNTGVDWLEVNEEWLHHQNYAKGHAENIDAAQEKIDYLNTTYSEDEVARGNIKESDRDAAMELKKTFELAKRGLEEQGYPEFGSQKHVDILHSTNENMKDDPDHQRRLQAYADRENTPIGESDSVTSTIRGAGNSISGAMGAGLATWRESRLYGLNPIAAGIHAAMSTIGEATGMGADQIRGMDLSKPLEQMPVGYEDSGLRSYFSIGIPGTNVGKRETMYERNKREAGGQGQTYRPPQTTTDEQEAALQRVQSAGRVTPTTAPAGTEQPEEIKVNANPGSTQDEVARATEMPGTQEARDRKVPGASTTPKDV